MSTIHERLREHKIKARINLSYVAGPGLGLIILQPSGAFYELETGGYACDHALAEGVFVPLHRETEGIDEATAEYVNYVLSLSPVTSYLKVDRTRLDDRREAWIYLNVHEPTDDPEVARISGFGECKGILVWGNSD